MFRKQDLTRRLPAEVLERIFQSLSYRDLRMAVLVCRRWREVGETPELWSSLPVTVNTRTLSLMPEILSSWRLRDVRKFVIRTSVSEEELSSILIRPGLRELVIAPDLLSSREATLLFTTICGGSQLKILDVSYNVLTLVEPGLLARAVSKLEVLEVAWSELTAQQTEAILTAVSEDSKLTYLNLSANRLMSVEPRLLARAVSRLETLDVIGTLLTRQQREIVSA